MYSYCTHAQVVLSCLHMMMIRKMVVCCLSLALPSEGQTAHALACELIGNPHPNNLNNMVFLGRRTLATFGRVVQTQTTHYDYYQK